MPHGAPHSKFLVPSWLRPIHITLHSVFEYTYLIFWNSFWTFAPVIAIGLFDRIVGKSRTAI